MHNLFQDFRYAFRQLRKSPGFSVTAVLTLTMAIAANIVVFGVLNALVLHPLRVPESQNLYQIQHGQSGWITMSYPVYRDIRDRNHSFSEVADSRVVRVGLEADNQAHAVWGYEASGNYFDLMGVKPLLGRFLAPSDDVKVNGSQVLVLSYASWKTHFNGDPNVVGKIVRLNKIPYTVIGVAPQYFNGTERFLWPELWIPVHNAPQIEGYDWLERRGNSNAWVVGRLKPGVTPEMAQADVTRIADQLAQEHPAENKSMTLTLAKPGFLGNALGGPIHGFLLGVMSLAALVLLAACANLGGLFSARTADRSKELGIRLAIGSSRGRILRQLLTESILISLLGGVAAAMASSALLHALSQFHPKVEIPVKVLVEPDRGVYLFAAALAAITGLLFGAIPARQIWRTDPNLTMKAAGGAVAGQRRFALRDILLVVQIALCCLLVTASFVSLQGLRRAYAMPLGIDPDGVVIAGLDTKLAGYDGNQGAALQQRLLDAVSAIPGVSAAAYSNTTPLSVNGSNTSVYPPGTTDFSLANSKFAATYFQVSPTYFAAAGTRMLYGRAFTEHDDKNSPDVAIVNQTFAKKLFGTENAVGKRYMSGPNHSIEIVGVVEDGKYETLAEDPTAALFWPIAQAPDNNTVLIVRSRRPTAEMLPAVRQAIASVDAGLPTFVLDSWIQALGLVTFPARAATVALGVLGTLAAMLAVTGIFGLASYTVSKRMRELGIRVALGARRKEVLQAALQRTAVLLAIGSVAGLALGVAASKVLAHIVYQATASDPLVIAGVALTMAAIGLASAAIPARRALAVDPARLLRDE
jgi:predicted permease